LPGVVLLFFGIKVLYHEHDSPTAREQINPTAWLMFIAAMRRALSRNAQLVILPNQDRLRVFQRETKRVKESLCVWNCPAVGEVKARRLSKQPSFLLALYHGSIGPSRLPLTVVDALARCDLRIKLRIVGYETVGHQGYITILTDRARQLGVLDHIEIRPAVPRRKDLFNLCHDCDFGLALMPMKSNDINMQNMTGASNKPFDYLACGLAGMVLLVPLRIQTALRMLFDGMLIIFRKCKRWEKKAAKKF
jgi:glycosyltransferase involved in cell wall biosynthesis